MAMKKGQFFTIDAIIAGGIIFSVVIFTSSLYVEAPPTIHLNYLSNDLISTLSSVTIKEINNEYINERIAGGDIDNLDNSVLQQIAEFWAKDDVTNLEYANKTMSNVTALFIPDNIGFGLWIDDEAIYIRDMPIRKSLISTKKIISGIEKGKSTGETRKKPPTLLGPVIAEVRVWQ